MELDTGAVVSVASELLYNCHRRRYSLEKTNFKLRDYHGRPLEIKGVTRVLVQYERQKRNLPLVIVAGNRPALLGRNWLEVIRINWPRICYVDIKGEARTKDTEVEEIIERHQAVFKDGYSVIKDFKATIHLKQGAKPVFRKNRAVPYAMTEAIATELDRLEKNKNVSKVDHSEWATPTVNISKKDKTVRICDDYKVTLNQLIDIDLYPLPTAEDIFATLAGGKQFTTLDFRMRTHSWRWKTPQKNTSL